MKCFLILLLTSFFSSPAEARWTVKSQFELLVGEKIFDQMIGDLWSALQGSQEIKINDLTVTPQGIPVYIQGIRTEVNYDFPAPKRVAGPARQWEIETENLSAKFFVKNVQAKGRILRWMDGIQVWIDVNATCSNLVLRLPKNRSHLKAQVRAELANNQVQLTLPSYEASWKPGSWELESVNCTGIEGFEEVVKDEALKALATFQNIDAPVREQVTKKFQEWSQTANGFLFSEQEIPTGRSYLKAFGAPKTARENGNGILLGGELRFEYPQVAPGQELVQNHPLRAGRGNNGGSVEAGNILLPFAAIKSLLQGEYLAGALTRSVESRDIPGFEDLMQDRWAQFWAFPHLNRYPTTAQFRFQLRPFEAPRFEQEAQSADGAIRGSMSLPTAVQMDSLLAEGYTPMVELRTEVAGPATIKLLKTGKLEFSVNAEKRPVSYGWEVNYVKKYQPDQRIAADTLLEKLRGTLSGMPFQVAFPLMQVGSLSVKPASWSLEDGNLRVNFVGEKAASVKANVKAPSLRR